MIRARIGLLILLSVACAACEKTRPDDSWASLPQNFEQASRLIAQHTRRPAEGGVPAFTAEALLTRLKQQAEKGAVIGGMDALAFWIWRKVSAAGYTGQSSYILWGTYHDSAAQIEAFGDLVGPLGLSKLDAVSIEQFNADGRWAGAAAREQRGDSALLRAWSRTGSRPSLEKLLHDQVAENYTAWKYGILPVLMKLLVQARAADRRLLGCDMSLSLQERVRPTGLQDRLRELHCVLALHEQLGEKPVRVAMLWGQGHLAPEGVQRFLPKEALILPFYVFGDRFSRRGLEADLAGRLAITDPLMIPFGESDFVVLLPDDQIGARKELKHDLSPLIPNNRRRLSITSSQPGTIQIGAQQLKVSEEPQTLTLDPGSHVFLFTHPGGLLAGAITMPPDGALALDLEPDRRFVEVILYRRTR